MKKGKHFIEVKFALGETVYSILNDDTEVSVRLNNIVGYTLREDEPMIYHLADGHEFTEDVLALCDDEKGLMKKIKHHVARISRVGG